MAASMATSTVSKAVLLPSNDASHSTPVSPRNPSLRFRFRPSAGVIGGRWNAAGIRRLQVVAMSSPPPAKGKISDLVDESIKHATEVCAGNDKSGECAAAWDEVEEVSAAASDIRTKEKVADPLENFCKDNPETDECRTYDS